MYQTQKDRVVRYLLAHRRTGATNFEMMMKLHVCDVRKILSEVRAEGEYLVEYRWETSKQGTRFKRYYLRKAK